MPASMAAAKGGKVATVVSDLWRRRMAKALKHFHQADGRFHTPTLRSHRSLATNDLNSKRGLSFGQKETALPWRRTGDAESPEYLPPPANTRQIRGAERSLTSLAIR